MINLRKIDEHFVSNADRLTKAQKAGIVAIEEVIHFIQVFVWGRPFFGTSDLSGKEHDEHPIEKEAKGLRKSVYDYLYPGLGLEIVGVD